VTEQTAEVSLLMCFCDAERPHELGARRVATTHTCLISRTYCHRRDSTISVAEGAARMGPLLVWF